MPYVQAPLFTLFFKCGQTNHEKKLKKVYLKRERAKLLDNQYKLAFGKTAPSTFYPDTQFLSQKDSMSLAAFYYRCKSSRWKYSF